MLKFFRTIRKKLIGQDNVRKYLLYAIGEILLVVIGILIALQINTWNEDQKKERARNQFEEALILELEKDRLLLVQSLEVLEKRIAILKTLKQRINAPGATLDTLDYIIRLEYDPSFRAYVSLNKNTFSTLSATGQIALFDATVADEIQNYYQSVISNENFMAAQVDFYRDMFATYLENVPNSENPYMKQYSLFETGQADDSVWSIVDANKARLLFRGITTLQLHILLSFHDTYVTLLEANHRLTEHLWQGAP
jgi:hypothetical protein